MSQPVSECAHPSSALIDEDLTAAGVPAIITVCSACGARIDYRPLREKDIEAKKHTQSYSRPALAEAAVNSSPAREEVSVVIQQEQEQFHSDSAFAGGRARYGLCAIHGGQLLMCSAGEGRAHECVNSKWGDRRRREEGRGRPGSCPGPCSCTECHVRRGWTR